MEYTPIIYLYQNVDLRETEQNGSAEKENHKLAVPNAARTKYTISQFRPSHSYGEYPRSFGRAKVVPEYHLFCLTDRTGHLYLVRVYYFNSDKFFSDIRL